MLVAEAEQHALAENTDSAAREHTTPHFTVALGVFDGPFDLLLSLIHRHELDITEVSLSAVTDEFISYISALSDAGDEGLDHASEFLEVAATLLDLKIARLLPRGEVVDADDVALLEARDLLFARLLQYRAFAEASKWFDERIGVEQARHPRAVTLAAEYRPSAARLIWDLSPEDFANLAVQAYRDSDTEPTVTVNIDHVHAPTVSLRAEAAYVVEQLRAFGTLTFRELTEGVHAAGVVVARFLAILELYRNDAIEFSQAESLAELHLTWSATQWSEKALDTLGTEYE